MNSAHSQQSDRAQEKQQQVTGLHVFSFLFSIVLMLGTGAIQLLLFGNCERSNRLTLQTLVSFAGVLISSFLICQVNQNLFNRGAQAKVDQEPSQQSLCAQKNHNKYLPKHINLTFGIMMGLAFASGVIVELCSSSQLHFMNEDEPEAKNDQQQDFVDKLQIARASIYFSVCVIEVYAGRMYTLLLLIICVISCCITGDDDKLNQIFPQTSNLSSEKGKSNDQKPNAVPQEDRPSIIENIQGNHYIEMPSPAASHRQLRSDNQSAQAPGLLDSQQVEEIRIQQPVTMIKEIQRLVKAVDTESLKNCQECGVCLNSFSLGEENVVHLKCNKAHNFHFECLSQWAHQSYTCPICRKPIISNKQEIESYRLFALVQSSNQHEDQIIHGSEIVN